MYKGFLAFFEVEEDVVLSVDHGVDRQPVPVVEGEFRQLIRQLLEGLEEGFAAGSLGFLLVDFRCDFLKISLGFLEPLREAIVAVQVFGLIQSDVGILINALLHHVGNHLRLLQELIVLGLQTRGVKE